MGEFGCLDVAAVRRGTTALKAWNFLQQQLIPVAALLPSTLKDEHQEFIINVSAKKDKMDKYFVCWDVIWVVLLVSAWFCLLYPKYKQKARGKLFKDFHFFSFFLFFFGEVFDSSFLVFLLISVVRKPEWVHICGK